jgi:leucyl-tRNA synthetase
MEERLPFVEIEPKWQKYWADKEFFKVKIDPSKPKYYQLEMYPYPSGDLHMGHVRNYIIGEATARYKRMKGYSVLYTMGFDSFGMPSEAAAIKHKLHPRTWTYQCIDKMRNELTRLGISYDWSRQLATCDPDYYRWNQWIFLKMFEKGLAYRKYSAVNWCPKCQTVLANEQVEDGGCWRCGETVIQKELEQWFLKITDYASQLVDDLDKLTGWSERAKSLQRNWIGKSYGVEIDFPIVEGQGIDERFITVFTTRPDTIYGCTYCVLSPEHPLVAKILANHPNPKKIQEFVDRVKNQDRTVETLLELPKEGIDTGIKAINPVNGEQISIFLANYVLMGYGTGAIMAVPTHDQRDFEFARKYGLRIKVVIDKPGEPLQVDKMECAYEEPGIMVNSNEFNGLKSTEAWDKITDKMVSEGYARRTVNYRIRDWGISRQRYWGTPIPMIYCEKCGTVPVPEKDLPVLLPENVDFTDYSGSPLKKIPEFVNVKCPKCGADARRETDTMDGFIDSSWYFLRYCTDPAKRSEVAFDVDEAKYWLPADLYIGGIDHATKHLIYARFFVKFLRDIGLLSIDEPFVNLVNQGWLLGTDGLKMSKSRGNVVDPNKMLAEYGADTVRVFMMFAAPPEPDIAWSDEGVEGSHRFLNRIWRIANLYADKISKSPEYDFTGINLSSASQLLRRNVHKSIKKVTGDIEDRFHFNTAIASMMELVNDIYKYDTQDIPAEEKNKVMAEAIQNLLLLICPLAPHMAEELWHRLGHQESIFLQPWPQFDMAVMAEDSVEIVVQINGKVKHRMNVPANGQQEEIKTLVMADSRIKEMLQGKEPKKVVVVPKKLVNIVI